MLFSSRQPGDSAARLELFRARRKSQGAIMTKLAKSHLALGGSLALLAIGSGVAIAEAPQSSLGTLEYGTDVY
jgi:hypothetical protein